MEVLFKKIVGGKIDKIPDRYSIEVRNFIYWLMQPKSDLRPTCKQIIESELYRKIRTQVENSYKDYTINKSSNCKEVNKTINQSSLKQNSRKEEINSTIFKNNAEQIEISKGINISSDLEKTNKQFINNNETNKEKESIQKTEEDDTLDLIHINLVKNLYLSPEFSYFVSNKEKENVLRSLLIKEEEHIEDTMKKARSHNILIKDDEEPKEKEYLIYNSIKKKIQTKEVDAKRFINDDDMFYMDELRKKSKELNHSDKMNQNNKNKKIINPIASTSDLKHTESLIIKTNAFHIDSESFKNSVLITTSSNVKTNQNPFKIVNNNENIYINDVESNKNNNKFKFKSKFNFDKKFLYETISIPKDFRLENFEEANELLPKPEYDGEPAAYIPHLINSNDQYELKSNCKLFETPFMKKEREVIENLKKKYLKNQVTNENIFAKPYSPGCLSNKIKTKSIKEIEKEALLSNMYSNIVVSTRSKEQREKEIMENYRYLDRGKEEIVDPLEEFRKIVKPHIYGESKKKRNKDFINLEQIYNEINLGPLNNKKNYSIDAETIKSNNLKNDFQKKHLNIKINENITNGKSLNIIDNKNPNSLYKITELTNEKPENEKNEKNINHKNLIYKNTGRSHKINESKDNESQSSKLPSVISKGHRESNFIEKDSFILSNMNKKVKFIN